MSCFLLVLFSLADCSTGTVKDAMIFRHAVLGDTGKDLVLGHVDAPRSGHIFVALCVPQRWGIGSYTRTTRTSIMEEYHGYEWPEAKQNCTHLGSYGSFRWRHLSGAWSVNESRCSNAEVDCFCWHLLNLCTQCHINFTDLFGNLTALVLALQVVEIAHASADDASLLFHYCAI